MLFSRKLLIEKHIDEGEGRKEGKRRGGLTSRVVIKETIQSPTIHEDTATIHNPQSPSHITLSSHTDTRRREIGIVPAVYDREHDAGVWVGLPVRRLRLDLAREHILRVRELVLVESVVLDRCADHPDCSGC